MFRLFLTFLLLSVPVANANPAAPPIIASTTVEAELSAIGRVRNWKADDGGCTAVLIAPRLALTAAHCARGNQKFAVVFDPTDDLKPKRMVVSQVITHPDFAGPAKVDTAYADLAVLVMAKDVPDTFAKPIPLGSPAMPDAPHAIYGFVNPGNLPLKGHPTCRILRISPGLLGSDCFVQSGMSGSPLLAKEDAGVVVVGIVVAKIPKEEGGVRALIAEVDPELLPEKFLQAKDGTSE